MTTPALPPRLCHVIAPTEDARAAIRRQLLHDGLAESAGIRLAAVFCHATPAAAVVDMRSGEDGDSRPASAGPTGAIVCYAPAEPLSESQLTSDLLLLSDSAVIVWLTQECDEAALADRSASLVTAGAAAVVPAGASSAAVSSALRLAAAQTAKERVLLLHSGRPSEALVSALAEGGQLLHWANSVDTARRQLCSERSLIGAFLLPVRYAKDMLRWLASQPALRGRRRPHVLLLAESKDEEAAKALLSSGGDDYLLLPLSASRLLLRLRAAMALRHMRQYVSAASVQLTSGGGAAAAAAAAVATAATGSVGGEAKEESEEGEEEEEDDGGTEESEKLQITVTRDAKRDDAAAVASSGSATAAGSGSSSGSGSATPIYGRAKRAGEGDGGGETGDGEGQEEARRPELDLSLDIDTLCMMAAMRRDAEAEEKRRSASPTTAADGAEAAGADEEAGEDGDALPTREVLLTDVLEQALAELADTRGFLQAEQAFVQRLFWHTLRRYRFSAIPAVDHNAHRMHVPTAAASAAAGEGGKAEEAAASSATVHDIGDYRLQRYLGEGAFSTVVLASHLETGAHVAIKQIEKRKVRDVDLLERLDSELRCMKALSHQNILSLVDVVHTPMHLHMITEYHGSGDLYQLLTEAGCVDEMTAKKMAHQLLSALAYMHARWYCHRDIKPENILIADGGRLVLADLGFAVKLSSSRKLRDPVGSKGFMAPEIHGNSPYDGRAVDIYSTGLVLLEMLCGTAVFRELRTELNMAKAAEIVAQLRSGSVLRDVSAECLVRTVCRRCCPAVLTASCFCFAALIGLRL
eukprot:PLAT11378.1.p1 GENE.PLAT11378.1~~PLAT11378.1.p1  ORF type:complete len:809 (-),score=277.47 PLAT11378.1:366-2792(-)